MKREVVLLCSLRGLEEQRKRDADTEMPVQRIYEWLLWSLLRVCIPVIMVLAMLRVSVKDVDDVCRFLSQGNLTNIRASSNA